MAPIKKINAGALRARLESLFIYNESSGTFTYAFTRGRFVVGTKSGSMTSKGYRTIMIDGRQYRAHRLVWLWHTGEWPDQEIDHINGQKDDNRFINLRLATSQQNNANRAPTRQNTSGLKGVSLNQRRGKWYAMIRMNGKNRHLGSFSTKEEAHKAYQTAALAEFGPFAYLGPRHD